MAHYPEPDRGQPNNRQEHDDYAAEMAEMDATASHGVDWYERRDELAPDQVFLDFQDSLVKLDRRVPGDGSRWYVANWNDFTSGWSYEDDTIEPGDLRERVEDPAPLKAA